MLEWCLGENSRLEIQIYMSIKTFDCKWQKSNPTQIILSQKGYVLMHITGKKRDEWVLGITVHRFSKMGEDSLLLLTRLPSECCHIFFPTIHEFSPCDGWKLHKATDSFIILSMWSQKDFSLSYKTKGGLFNLSYKFPEKGSAGSAWGIIMNKIRYYDWSGLGQPY